MSFQRQYLAVVTVGFLATLPASAISSHTWVAGYGNDANPCSVTQPCATFQAAHTATSPSGVISVLSPGDFGPVIISKSITIDGGAIGGSITYTGSQGIDISAGTSDTVILRHLTVNGLNTGSDGIFLYQARYVIIEDCDVEGFLSVGLAFLSRSATNVTVTNTRIIGGTWGVYPSQSSGGVPYDVISMRHVVVSGASIAAVYSQNGTMEISDSLITQSGVGVLANTNAFVNVANSVISYNATDELFIPSTIGGIFIGSSNTLFGNNGVPGPPAGPAVVIRPNSPLPPDAPRPPRR